MEYYPTTYPSVQQFPRRTSPRQNMSIAATFRLAQQARGKLSFEASRQDHDLRLLVGHANLLDSLMVELAEAERKQERWFDEIIREEEEEEEEDDEEEEYEDEESEDEYEDEMEYEIEQPEIYGSLPTDYESDSSDSDSDCDEEEYFVHRRIPTKPHHHTREIKIAAAELSDASDDEMMIEDIEDDEDGLYNLTRTTSHQSYAGSPPSLCSDLSDDEDLDDHSMPPSPPQPVLHHPPPSALAKSKDVATMMSGFFDVPGNEPPRELGDHGFYHDIPLFPRAPTIATF